jgi:hypothetical protein
MDTPESKPLRNHWLMRVLLSKTFIIAVALMITYTLAGFFLAPYLIKRQATRFARESLKCLVVMEEVRVNPYALTLDIRNFDLKERDGSPLLAFKAFFINFEISSLWHWAWTFADVRLEGPAVNLEIKPGNRINFIEIADRIPKKENEGKTSRQEKAGGEARPPRVIFEHIALNQGRLVFTDRSGPTPGSIALEPVGLELKNLTTLPGKKGICSFEASLAVREGGAVYAKGRFTLAQKSAEATVHVSNLALTPFQPYLARYAYLSVDAGDLSVAGKVSYRKGEKGPNLQFSGDAHVADLLVSELDTKLDAKQRFIAWQALEANDIKLGLGPEQLEIGEVRLIEPYGKLIIYEDKTVNLKKVLRPQGETVEETNPALQAEAPGGFPVDVRRILIEKGLLDFADLSLRLQFAAKIYELKGTIVGLSTKEGERAQIQLDGRVDEYGMSRIQGQTEPLNVKRFADITMLFKNVEMTNLTPYSGKFAGYRIASGKLSLDLHYLIEQSELKGSNQIILDNLTLGEKVESPAATNIPLKFALALLKDADGRIDIGLPVSGNLDDPQFSYGHLIWKALINLFTKIVTSPFRALGGMFGVDKENLGTIAFEPGRVVLPPPEREKVKILSEALAKRPQLMLKIQGRFDPAADGEALKSMAIRFEIARRTGREVVPGKDAGPVNVSNPPVQQAIETMVIERISAGDLAAAKENAAKQAAVMDKEAGKAAKKEKKQAELLPPDLSRELYTALLQKLVEAHPVTEARLNELARERAEAIKQEFVAAGAIDEGRLTVLEPTATEEEAEGSVSSELTLDVRR